MRTGKETSNKAAVMAQCRKILSQKDVSSQYAISRILRSFHGSFTLIWQNLEHRGSEGDSMKPIMPVRQGAYIAFMLRLWLAAEGEGAVWRASLEDPHTGERLTFKSLDRLFAFLEDQCDQATEKERSREGTG